MVPDQEVEILKEYQAFIYNLPIAAGRFTLREGGTFEAVNRAFIDRLGYKSKEEISHLPLHALLPTIDRVELKREAVERGFEIKRISLKKRDGSLISPLSYVCPIFDRDGELSYLDLLIDTYHHGEGVCHHGEYSEEVNVLKKRLFQMRVIHTIAIYLERARDEKEIYRLTIHSAETILGLCTCIIGRNKREGLEILAYSSPIEEKRAHQLFKIPGVETGTSDNTGAGDSIYSSSSPSTIYSPLSNQLFFSAISNQEKTLDRETKDLLEILLLDLVNTLP